MNNKDNTRIDAYFVARNIKGLSKKLAQVESGFKGVNHGQRIESTKRYKEIDEKFKQFISNFQI